jgi:hypothetical protein
MKRVFSGPTLVDIVHLQNLLEQAGIRSFIKNRALGGALGDLPFLDCAPELWVLNDTESGLAENVIREALAPDRPGKGAPWHCPHCRERNEAQFAVCWNCGAEDASD